MNLTRNFTRILNYVIDEFLPPALRDRLGFIWLPFRLVLGASAGDFARFKGRALLLSKAEFAEVYRRTAGAHLQRETDLNSACIEHILAATNGNVLEVGCGRGYLAGRLALRHRVTACDLRLTPDLADRYPQVEFLEAGVEQLPFADATFETVVCTHTLEHVQDFSQAIAELRRVSKDRLLIVVPRQRPYRYTFDLHVRFFPYEFVLLDYFRPQTTGKPYHIELLAGDWYYQEG